MMVKSSAPPSQKRHSSVNSARWGSALALPSLKPPTSTSAARTRYRPPSPRTIAVSTRKNARLIGWAAVRDGGVQARLSSVVVSETRAVDIGALARSVHDLAGEPDRNRRHRRHAPLDR